MSEKIKKILEELYSADPSLKKDEARIVPILEKLIKDREEVSMDRKFKEDLREKLLAAQSERAKIIPMKKKKIIPISLAAAALLAAAIFLPVMTERFGGYEEAAFEQAPGEKSLVMTKMAEGAPEPQMSMVMADEAEAPMMMREESVGSAPVDFNTEGYARIYENDFLNPMESPLSTFSIDVDTASYANVRRFLYNGSLPPADAVRIEELVNYFDYSYNEPSGEHPFSVETVLSEAPWNRDHLLLRIGLQGKRISLEDLPPNNLVFLLDVSGSMNEPDKLPLLKNAMKLIVSQMREEDRISIVVYAGAAGTVLEPTGGKESRKILEALDHLEAGGSTAGAEGIALAYEKALENFDPQGNNRIILATDGDFNVGVSSDGELIRLVEAMRNHGVGLTIVGFGTGNLKDSRMEQIADKGNGNYAYIDNLMEARKVLVEEMGGTFFTIAKDVKLQVEFNPLMVESYRLIGYENRLLNRQDFHDDSKDAGELGAGHNVTAFYELIPADGTMKSEELKYQQSTVKVEAVAADEILTLSLRYKKPEEEESRLLEYPVSSMAVPLEETGDDFRFASSVVQWGMLLRGSEYSGDSSFESVLETARRSRGNDPKGYRSEFLRLVELSRVLKE